MIKATVLGQFNVRVNGEVVDTFVLRDKGGNHGAITNKSNVLYDGDLQHGISVWDKKVAENIELCKFAEQFGYEFELIK